MIFYLVIYGIEIQLLDLWQVLKRNDLNEFTMKRKKLKTEGISIDGTRGLSESR